MSLSLIDRVVQIITCLGVLLPLIRTAQNWNRKRVQYKCQDRELSDITRIMSLFVEACYEYSEEQVKAPKNNVIDYRPGNRLVDSLVRIFYSIKISESYMNNLEKAIRALNIAQIKLYRFTDPRSLRNLFHQNNNPKYATFIRHMQFDYPYYMGIGIIYCSEDIILPKKKRDKLIKNIGHRKYYKYFVD